MKQSLLSALSPPGDLLAVLITATFFEALLKTSVQLDIAVLWVATLNYYSTIIALKIFYYITISTRGGIFGGKTFLSLFVTWWHSVNVMILLKI